MSPLIHAALIAFAGVLTDPSSCVIAVGECPDGILLSNGADQGLYLLGDDGAMTELSAEPGAGRNVVIAGGEVLFKECPPGEAQRISGWSRYEGGHEIFQKEGDFCGPFPSGGDGFLTIESGELVLHSMTGVKIDSWWIGEGSAWAAATDRGFWLTSADGGIRFLGRGDSSLLDLPAAAGRTWSRVEAGPGGMVLATGAGGGFLVLDADGSPLVDRPDGLFPTWTPDGSILSSILAFEGLVPCDGGLELLDPLSAGTFGIPMPGIPVHPLPRASGAILCTDASEGTLLGLPPVRLPSAVPPGPLDDPVAHFDVPYMHQRWDTPDWFNGSWSCGPTSCVMAVQFYGMLTPDSIWASYPSPGHWSPWGNYIPVEYTFLGHTYDILGEAAGGEWVPGAHGFICREYGGAVWNYMVSFLQQHEVASAWAGQAWSTLTGQLDQGHPVVCSSTVLGYGHIILFNGYYSNHTVIVNDPYGDANAGGWGSYYNGKDVLYDWPGYNNGHVEIGVSQLFTAIAAIPDEPDTLVDDRSRGFEKLGGCQYWHLAGTGYGGDAWWTYSTGAPPDTCVARWTPALPETGEYEVRVHIPVAHAQATGIYRIETVSGTVEVSLDQGDYSGEWASLGIFTMEQGDRLILGDYTGTQGEHIAFDAALFIWTVTGLSEETGMNLPGLTVGPNPCVGSTIASCPTMPADGSFALYDLTGRLLLRVSPADDGSAWIDLSSLAPGVFLLRAEMAPGAAFSTTGRITVLR